MKRWKLHGKLPYFHGSSQYFHRGLHAFIEASVEVVEALVDASTVWKRESFRGSFYIPMVASNASTEASTFP